MDNLQLKLISAEKVIFDGSVDSVKFPGANGEFSILNNHAPFMSSLDEGLISYKKKGEAGVTDVEILSGFVEISKNIITACVEI